MEDKYYTESHKKAIDRYDKDFNNTEKNVHNNCLLYTSPSPRDA